MKSIRLFLLSSLLLMLPNTVFATDDFEMDKLKSLFEKYQRKQAYQYASEHLSEHEGDPYFDYYYGVSAIDAGFASQGVFALERVLLVFPQDSVARLELARGYFILEEYSRSRQEFEDVLAKEPPDSVKRTAYLYLDKIRLKEARYKTTVSGFVELGAGYDTNVNSAPDDNFSGLLTPSSTEQEDNFYNVAAQFKVGHPFSPGWVLNLVATGILKKNQDLSEFDTTTASVQTGIAYQTKASQYNLDLVAQEFQLDGESYRTLLGTNLGWKYTISEISNFTTSFQYADLSYDQFPVLDSSLYTLNMGYTHQFAVQLAPVFFSNLKLGVEKAKSDDAAAQANTERNIYSLRLGVALSLSSNFIVQSAVGLQNSQYDAQQLDITGNITTREDNYASADVTLLWLINHDWRLDTRISYVNNDSNLEVRKYDRTLASINLNYSY